MLKKSVLFISTKNWFGETEVSCHHIVKELVKENNKVIYVQNYGSRSLDFNLIVRGVKRLFNKIKKPKREIKKEVLPDNLILVKPFFIPFHQSKSITKLNIILISKKINKVLKENDLTDPIIWTRSPTDLTESIINKIKHSLLVYHSVDNFIEHPTITGKMKDRYVKSEDTFSRKSDVIFTSAYNLFKEKSTKNRNVHYFPNGVSLETFNRGISIGTRHLSDMEKPMANGKCNVCFVGNIGSWVDCELLMKVANHFKDDINLILIGPTQVNIDNIEKMENVFYLGEKEFDTLPSYLRLCDIGIIPYKINEFTKYTFPSKLMEYLASDLNVISTELEEVSYFQDYVYIAESHQMFLVSIQEILNGSDKRKALDRKSLVEKFSWEDSVARMTKVINEQFS